MCNQVTTDMRSRWQKKDHECQQSVYVPGLYFSNYKRYVYLTFSIAMSDYSMYCVSHLEI